MEAGLVGRPEDEAPRSSWWSRNGRLASTVGSGAALGLGPARLVVRDGGGPGTGNQRAAGSRLLRTGGGLGGAWLYPRALRSLRRLRLDIDVLMGLAILGAIGLGQWDEAATVAFLFGLSEALESLSLDRARRAIRELAGDRAPDRRADRPDGSSSDGARPSEVRAGDRVLVRAGDTIPVDGEVIRGGRASTRRRSRASRCRWSAGRATRSTPGRSTARGRWRSRRPGRSATP